MTTSENNNGIDGFLSPASFRFPEALVESAWHGHAPFAFWLMETLKPRQFVELGTHHGFAYLTFCQAAERGGWGARGYAVDRWTGDEHAGFYGEAVYQALRNDHDPRYGSFSRLVRSTFDEALAHFAENTIDLLHLDGRHFYDDVKHDFESWKSRLSNRAVVLFHDTNVHERSFGVSRLWTELRQHYPGFEFLHSHGLGVLGIGTALPEALNRLFAAAADPDLATAIREVYARLGLAVEERYRLTRREAALRRSEDELGSLRRWQSETAGPRLIERLALLDEKLERLGAQQMELLSVREVQRKAERDLAVQRGLASERLQEIERLHAIRRTAEEANKRIERQLAETRLLLGDFRKRSTSSRWLLRSMTEKAVHAPRDLSRRARQSWSKRRSGAGPGAARSAKARFRLANLRDPRYRKYLSSWLVLWLEPALPRSFVARMQNRLEKHAPLASLLHSPRLRGPLQSLRLPGPRMQKPASAMAPGRRPILNGNGAAPVLPPSKRFEAVLENENFRWYLHPDVCFDSHRLSVVYVSGEPNRAGETYRVLNYVEALRQGDIAAYWLRPQDIRACIDPVLSADILVIWRHKFTLELEKIVLQRRKEGRLSIYDTDDLMIRPDIANSKYIDAIRFNNFNADHVANHYAMHQKMLMACDAGFASTESLAEVMRELGKPAFVVPNGFGNNVLKHSLIGRSELLKTAAPGAIRIGYSSGSRTHQKDFACAAPALARVMRDYPQVLLTVFGPTLDLSEFPEFAGLEAQIESRSLIELDHLPYETVRFDINIAPLEAENIFCECKSELKYFEAALAGVPTIASPTGPFRKAITHGQNGLLANSEDEWFAALERLVIDAPYRSYLARNALARTCADFGPEAQFRAAMSAINTLMGSAAPVQAGAPGQSYPAVQLAPHQMLSAKPGDRAGEVAVIVPLYNYGAYVAECLDSVRSQSNASQLDIIVVDDCSSDGSEDNACSWLQEHGGAFNSWMLLRHDNNNGLEKARNLGISYSRASYYFPLDADNILEPDCLERVLQKFKERDGVRTLGAVYPALQLFGDCTTLFPDTDRFVDVGKWDPERLSRGNYIDAMALIRKSAWRRVGGYTDVTERGGWQDYDFWCKFVECGLHAEYEPAAVAHYRTHQTSMLHKRTHARKVFPELAARIQEKHPWLSLGA
jgi:GT2 family glycosyltransferase/glycosyltransferase involved in cell wall biosynthesis